jgi:hypothetical protein
MNRSIRIRAGALGVLLALAISVGKAQSTADQDRIPVLAELFTSEGCSSCPPADRILEWLSKEQPVDGVYVVAMSEHVTYWDHQGWKDPFGSPRFTQRQQMYGARFKVADIFTPQLVIDGTIQLIGSDTAALKRALTDASRKPKPRLTVEASFTADGSLSGSASGPGLEVGAAEGAELLWAVTEDDLAVDVSRGENAKRTLHHSGVVRALIDKKIERGNAAPMNVVTRVPSEWKRGNLRLVAFVQSTKTRRVLSVGWVAIALR